MSLSYILLHLYTVVKEPPGLRGRAVLRDNGAREEGHMDVYALLRGIQVLEKFDDAAVGRLAAASRVGVYTTNQLVLRCGAHVDFVGVVASGEIEIRLGGEAPGAAPPRLREGQLFGEMSLLTGEPAIADVVAAAASQVIHIPHDALTREIGLTLHWTALRVLLGHSVLRFSDEPSGQCNWRIGPNRRAPRRLP